MATYALITLPNGRVTVKGIDPLNVSPVTGQYIGRPAGPKAKGHKTPATGTLPYVRRSVVGRHGNEPTKANAKRAKHLRAARATKIRAAKNSVEI